tara:strand:+ start:39 stop:167 length:129 start_codon:yes stop_codon:yes gene_type:complete
VAPSQYLPINEFQSNTLLLQVAVEVEEMVQVVLAVVAIEIVQ